MHRMRELLHQEKGVHHLDFSPMKGILVYLSVFFDCLDLKW